MAAIITRRRWTRQPTGGVSADSGWRPTYVIDFGDPQFVDVVSGVAPTPIGAPARVDLGTGIGPRLNGSSQAISLTRGFVSSAGSLLLAAYYSGTPSEYACALTQNGSTDGYIGLGLQ